jgi:hypothetical protein
MRLFKATKRKAFANENTIKPLTRICSSVLQMRHYISEVVDEILLKLNPLKACIGVI